MQTNPAVDAGPLDYDYSVDFDYSVWSEDTIITLCNVRWDAAYRDVVDFRTRANLNTYINGLPGKLDLVNYSLIKPFEDAVVDLPHNVASRFNYIRVSNPAQPVGNDVQKDFYYFITGVTYDSPEATRYTLQLDVYQTYRYDITFGNCYIERGHLGIANENNFDNHGRTYLTVPEGIDTGAEYMVAADRSEKIMGPEAVVNGGNVTFIDNTCVIIVTTQDITAPAGTKDDPNRVTSKGSRFQNIASGASYWAFKSQDLFRQWMESVSETPWIGESVVVAFMAPRLDRYADFTWNETGPTNVNNYVAAPNKFSLFPNWRDANEILSRIPERFRHLRKFFTYPYMLIELTTWTGTPIIIKPELWASSSARVIERASMVAPGQRIEFHALSYNARPGVTPNNWQDLPDIILDALPPAVAARYRETGDDHGDFWDHATKITNLPSVIMVNDAATSYIASNVNSISYAKDSAQWDQQRALASNTNSYDNATSGINQSQEANRIAIQEALLQTGNANRTEAAQTAVSAIGNTVGGLVGGGSGLTNVGIGALNSGISGGAAAINTGINIASRDEANAISSMASRSQMQNQTKTAGEIRDRNKSLADWAAQGDYANKIASVNAKVLDARMIPPTTSGQVGGETMNLTSNEVKLSARWKIVDDANLHRIGEFWLRFGYAINRFYTVTDQLVMEKATYWKMTQCYIVAGEMPEIFKDAYRGIFEKGVTVYANANDIGTLDWGNNPAKAGITL